MRPTSIIPPGKVSIDDGEVLSHVGWSSSTLGEAGVGNSIQNFIFPVSTNIYKKKKGKKEQEKSRPFIEETA